MTSNRKQRGIRSIAFKNSSIASTKKSSRRRNRMLSQAQRTTILELNTQGVSKREIARVLGISRVAVRKVLRSNSTALPELHRTEKAEPHRQRILELFEKCKGNLVRVHEELVAAGAELSYTALTAFCRRHGIGYAPPVPAGRYDFAPAEELQHDTSPHELELGGRKRKVQTASAVLCYSRMLFFQCYPTFRRFDCKVFLTEALRYFGGARRHTVGRLPAHRSDAGRRWPPSAGNPPGFGGPPAPETSTPPAPGSGPRAPAAGSLPAEPPPAPDAAISSSRCDRTGAPTHRGCSRSAAPTRSEE